MKIYEIRIVKGHEPGDDTWIADVRDPLIAKQIAEFINEKYSKMNSMYPAGPIVCEVFEEESD